MRPSSSERDLITQEEAPIIELRWRICGDDEILAAENIMENKTINNSSLEGEI